MDFKAVIPARFASTRLPGKPLADIGGVPMVVRVAQRAQAAGASEVIVATDHAGIRDAVQQHGLRACMTSPDHASGTDRIAEVARIEGWPEATLVVNVQGDEPLVDPALIRAVAETLDRHPDAVMSTACHPLRGAADFANPNVVKVVLDHSGHALYFSRAPIPWPRDAFAAGPGEPPPGLPCHRHIGIYGYRAGFLAHYAGLEPAPIERFESLEQLRVLWHGLRIACAVFDHAPAPGVDTPEDLERVRALFDRPGD